MIALTPERNGSIGRYQIVIKVTPVASGLLTPGRDGGGDGVLDVGGV